MTDVTVNFGDFSTTTVEFTAISENAKAVFAEQFGFACVSVNVRKSMAEDFAKNLESRELLYS